MGAGRRRSASCGLLLRHTRAAIPEVRGLKVASPLTHIEALELDYAPWHLIVLVGGYVGVEMAQAFRPLR